MLQVRLYSKQFKMAITSLKIMAQYRHTVSCCVYRRLGAKGSYLTLVRVADRIL